MIAGNKEIAEFMGSRYINEPYKANKEDTELTDFWHWTKPENGWPKDAYTGQEYSTGFMIENWAYHKSFDWLMPACKKFNELDQHEDLPEEYFTWRANLDFAVTTYDIKEAHKVFVEAITWYKSHNTK